MSGTDRFERMIRWYPPEWRARYGDELTALLEDTYETAPIPLRQRLALAKAGSVERIRATGLRGDATAPDDRMRAGSLLVLCAWTLFVVAGALFAKFSEHWDVATPPGDRRLPTDGYQAVQWAGGAGVVIVLAAACMAVPSFIRLVKRGDWSTVRRPVLAAVAMGVAAVAATTGIVVWSHHLGPNDRNRAVPGFRVAAMTWGLVVVAALATATVAAVSVARRLELSRRTLRALGAMAVILTALMGAILVGTVTWWVVVALDAPQFLGSGAWSTSNVLPPPLLVSGGLMVIGLGAAAAGTACMIRSARTVTRTGPRTG
jgi:hypothetical protein